MIKKNVERNNYQVFTAALVSLLIVATINAERPRIRQDLILQRIAAKKAQREKLAAANQPKIWTIYSESEGPQSLIYIAEKVLIISQTLKNMIEDITARGIENAAIAVNASSLTIQTVFYILQLYKHGLFEDIDKSIDLLNTEQLMNVFIFLDWLEVAAELKNIFVHKIKNMNSHEVINNTSFEKIDPHAQKLLLVDSILDCLTNKMVKKNIEKRKIFLKEHPFPVTSVVFSPDGNKIVSGCLCEQQNLMVWDSNSGQKLYDLIGHRGNINMVAFSPDGSKIISSDNSATIIVWDSSSGKKLYNLVDHRGNITAAAFSPDGSKIVSASAKNKNLMVWDSASGQKLYDLTGHSNIVKVAVFSPDGSKIVSGSAGNKNLIVWDSSSGQKLYDLVGHSDVVVALAFSPDGSKIVSGSWGKQNNLIVWDSNSGEKLHNLIGHPNHILDVLFSPDGSKIISGCESDQYNLIVWDSNSGEKLHDLIGHPGYVYTIKFSPNGSKIVSGSWGDQYNLILWDSNTGQKLHDLVGHHSSVKTVAFHPDGNKIISGSWDDQNNNLILWTLWTKQEEEILHDLKCENSERLCLLHRLCLAQQQKIAIELTDADQVLLNSLPDYMGDLFK